jgi:hypothetical protein
MKRVCVLALFAVALLPVASARAVSTRAEYIAQVDPICQSFVGSHDAALSAYNKSAKRMLHLSGSGTIKAWLAATRRASKLLTALTQNQLALLDQIAAVPPAAPDAGTIGTWLNGRRQSDAFAASAAAALNRPVPQVGKFFKKIKQANSALDAADRAITGFGFQVCGVSV